MNLLPGEALGDATARLEDGQIVPLPVHAAAGRKVLFGIRPEHLSRSAGPDALSVKVDVVEPTGAETLVASELGETEVMAALKGHHKVTPGDSLELSIDVPHIHVFDAGTGLRLD